MIAHKDFQGAIAEERAEDRRLETGAGDHRQQRAERLALAPHLAADGFVLSAHTMVDADVEADALDDELRLLLTRGLVGGAS